jgi:protein phosphatase
VRSFWARVEAETAERRELARFLIDHLSWKEPTVPQQLDIRYAALSENGLVRESNQDAAYADSRLLAVADGFGASGASASAAAIEALKSVESLPAGDLLNVLDEAVEQAGRAVTGITGTEESGTTLTAMLWTGSGLALVHIGDSRAYLLRGGELFQITTDHTMVQSMVDDGRLTPEEATAHPQRALLLKALWGTSEARPDIRLHDAEAGDRYLLCSDGLSAVVPPEEVRRVISSGAEPEAAVRELVDLAIAAGGPDNVSCVVADVARAD